MFSKTSTINLKKFDLVYLTPRIISFSLNGKNQSDLKEVNCLK